MVSAGDHQLYMRHFVREREKSINQNFWPFVSAPFAECDDSVFRISTA